MAQAARLNLRMHKELKLLLTDPPPAASFPSLSDSSSLTSIDADFQGPEGTVYANGVFKIKIQIPERYPFQPPIVTFATPIYHPNIDTGGRICLDILNLPPKGSWQPSLNISTVLTSIGLLLSEPNPDDGLMHEASREYKYSRQTFDQKARSMTEKYAKPGESKSFVNSHEIQTHTCLNTLQNEVKGYATNFVTEHSVCNTRSSGSSKRLSLGSSSDCDSGREISKVPDHDNSYNQSENKRAEYAKTIGTEHYNNPEKLQATRNKLAIGSRSGVGVVTNGNIPNHCKYQLGVENPSEVSPDLLPLGHVGKNEKQVMYLAKDSTESCSMSINQETLSLQSVKTNMEFDRKVQHSVPTHNIINPQKDVIERSRGGSTSTRTKKLGLVGSGTSYKPEHEKENPAPIQCLLFKPSDPSAASPIKSPIVSENGIYQRQSRWKQTLNVAQKLSGMSARLPLKPQENNPSNLHFEIPDARLDKEQQTNQVLDKEESTLNGGSHSHIHEATIVSDSEDSDDDNVPVRSKLSLTRKCLSRKRKLYIHR